MRSLTLVLAATLLATSLAAPAEAGRHKRKKKCCAAKQACCQTDTGYRAAEWGSSWYHTDANCKVIAQVPKEKLVTDLPAMYGRRKHHCCAACN